MPLRNSSSTHNTTTQKLRDDDDKEGDKPWEVKLWKIDRNYLGVRHRNHLTLTKLNANLLTLASTDSALGEALAWAWLEYFGIQIKGAYWDPNTLMGDGAPTLPCTIYAGRIDHELSGVMLSLWYGDGKQETPWVFEDPRIERSKWLAIGILLLSPFCFKSCLYIAGSLLQDTFRLGESMKEWSVQEILLLATRGRRFACFTFENGECCPVKFN